MPCCATATGSETCPNLDTSHDDYVKLLREIRSVKGVKKVFVRSGLRYDYVLADHNKAFVKELCQYHVSGQLKVAPEHVADEPSRVQPQLQLRLRQVG